MNQLSLETLKALIEINGDINSDYQHKDALFFRILKAAMRLVCCEMVCYITVENGVIVDAKAPIISAQCIRVPVADGHLAATYVKFKNKPSKEQIIEAWNNYKASDVVLNLPSAPKQFIKYMEEDNRPQTKLDRDYENGMGITVGRLREDTIFDYKFVGLSHNTLIGAAGGGVLSAEYLTACGYITAK